MKTTKPSMAPSTMRWWLLLINLPLIAITVYVHYLLVTVGESYGDNIAENVGLWLLMIFKIAGANLIFMVIVSGFKIEKS